MMNLWAVTNFQWTLSIYGSGNEKVIFVDRYQRKRYANEGRSIKEKKDDGKTNVFK